MSYKRTVFALSLLFILGFVALLGGVPLQAQSETPTPTPRPLADPENPDGERTDFNDSPADPSAPTACSVPVTASVRGKSVDFDQCYESTFSHDSTTYSIHVFYTEQDSTNNLDQCDATENSNNRCEHKLSDNDDSNGDNVNAVAMATEAQAALTFYLDRNIDMINGTTLSVYIAEDPRGGGINGASGLYADDELIDGNDVIWKRLLAFHEGMHLVQDKYDNGGVGWKSFYGEGIARAIEDRVDVPMDADTGHLFIPEVDGILGSEANRTDDIVNTTYRSVLWWTWLMDQYRAGSDTNPDIGWAALRDFYIELNSESDQVKAINDFISAEGGSFRDDFIDYTLSLYAYDLNPSDPRLTYLDNEILNNTAGLRNHTIINSGPAFGNSTVSMNPRSVRFIEFDPASQCDFVAFTFDGNGKNYGFSVMTADSGNLQNRWTSYSDEWARTVRSGTLDSVVGVVTAFDQSGNVDIGRGCVEPTLNIKNPTTAAFEMIGTADNPRNYIVRLDVDGKDGSGVAGLTASDFTVEMEKVGGGPTLNATVINATYVQDDYWLLVTPPSDSDGAESGQFYDLTVRLGSLSDSENSSLLYVKRTQDVVIVLDRSGSMSFASGKIAAARNAAALLVNELADDDQGAYVAFDTIADLKEQLDAVGSGPGSHREALENAIGSEVPLNATAIGLGMQTAATEHDTRGNPDNMCSFILLSDGYENVSPYWADVQAQVADNGCAIHTIALGPQANDLLMQQIASAVPGGSFDYADISGNVPISVNSPNAPTADALGWENNLSRIYDNKAIQIAGRQRLQTAQSFGNDNLPFESYKFYVDQTTSELVIAVAWQSPTKGEQQFKLIDPDGNTVTPDYQRFSDSNRNEVLKVFKPAEGMWELQVSELFQEYFVSVSSITNYELYLFVGTPLGDLTQGAKVPLLGTFVGPGEPVLGATMTATVRSPNGMLSTIMLVDDGNHGDGEPDDGIYGGEYTATAASQDMPESNKVIDGEEPNQLGSYLVNLVATRGDLRREAQGSFAIETGEDNNDNRLPDAWEREYGVSESNGDDDRDKLNNYCEFQLGTDPRNSDTDGGGESDGSEAPNCQPVRDPLDPNDDTVGPILSVTVRPEILDQIRVIILNWGNPIRGNLQFVNIYRRTNGDGWTMVGEGMQGNSFIDGDVADGASYEYMIEPMIDGQTGAMVASTAVVAKNDPYAPAGSILINNGEESTTDRTVTLSIAADDLAGEGDGEPNQVELPGSATEDLEMRLSNSSDFEGVAWQPFASEVTGWALADDVGGGDTAVVYVQFRDEAGNVSQTGFAHSDSIFFAQWDLYLPLISR